MKYHVSSSLVFKFNLSREILQTERKKNPHEFKNRSRSVEKIYSRNVFVISNRKNALREFIKFIIFHLLLFFLFFSHKYFPLHHRKKCQNFFNSLWFFRGMSTNHIQAQLTGSATKHKLNIFSLASNQILE